MKAFSLCDMNKRVKIAILIALIGVFAILALQALWVSTSYKQEQKKLVQKAVPLIENTIHAVLIKNSTFWADSIRIHYGQKIKPYIGGVSYGDSLAKIQIYNPKTKKYVMWMHLEFRKGKFAKSPKLEHILSESPDYRTARVGVAVADKVAGPYKFIRSFRPQAGVYPINDAEKLKAFRRELDAKNPNWRDCDLNKNRPSDEAVARGQFFLRDFEGGQMARDMTLFVDDDGKAYYACASEENATLQIHELSDDFQGFTGRYVRVLRGDYHEAPAFFKKDGKYWLFTSHCTGWAPNPGRISVCDSMLGEWKEIGNPCRGEGQKKSRTRPYSAKPDTTFLSQSTAVIPVQGKKDAFIYVGDRWISEDAIDGRYVFLPVEWENGTPVIRWYDKWDLSIFDKDKK